MNEFIYNNFEHILCFLILIARLGDIISTYLITPTLKLEANPIVKKLGWRFAILTVLICLLPYYHTGLAVMALVPSLLVSASNTAKIWVIRAMGEDEFSELFLRIVAKSSLSKALLCVFMSSFFVALAGFILLALCYGQENWGHWFAIGIILYAFVIAIYGSLYYCKLFKKAKNLPETNPKENTNV